MEEGTLRSHFYSGRKFNLEQAWEGSINYFRHKDHLKAREEYKEGLLFIQDIKVGIKAPNGKIIL